MPIHVQLTCEDELAVDLILHLNPSKKLSDAIEDLVSWSGREVSCASCMDPDLYSAAIALTDLSANASVLYSADLQCIIQEHEGSIPRRYAQECSTKLGRPP